MAGRARDTASQHSTARGTTVARSSEGAVGWWGLALLATGVALVVLAYATLHWYGMSDAADTAPATTFANLRASVDQFGGAKAASVYFDWLSWTLLAATVVLGTAGNVRGRWTETARVLGFVAGAAGVLSTYYALLQYSDAQADAGAAPHNPLYNAGWGLGCVLGGYVLAALGAVLGPRTPKGSG